MGNEINSQLNAKGRGEQTYGRSKLQGGSVWKKGNGSLAKLQNYKKLDPELAQPLSERKATNGLNIYKLSQSTPRLPNAQRIDIKYVARKLMRPAGITTRDNPALPPNNPSPETPKPKPSLKSSLKAKDLKPEHSPHVLKFQDPPVTKSYKLQGSARPVLVRELTSRDELEEVTGVGGKKVIDLKLALNLTPRGSGVINPELHSSVESSLIEDEDFYDTPVGDLSPIKPSPEYHFKRRESTVISALTSLHHATGPKEPPRIVQKVAMNSGSTTPRVSLSRKSSFKNILKRKKDAPRLPVLHNF